MRTLVHQFAGISTKDAGMNTLMLHKFAEAVCRQELGITIPQIRVTSNITLRGSMYYHGVDGIVVDRYQFGELHPFHILSHELRHSWQSKMGLLIPYKMGFLWNNKYYPLTDITTQEEYEALPWEKDANDYANGMMRRLK